MPAVNLSATDLIVIAVYVVAIIAWGLYHSGRKSAEDYFLGGRGMTWPLIGLSMLAMCVSSSSLVGWSGDAYHTGIAVFNYGISGAIIVLVFFLVFFLPFYLRNKVYTMPEFLEGRFDSRSRYYFSFISIVGYAFLDSAVTLYAGALMIQMAFPTLSLGSIIWCLAILAASYTVIGGLKAVMWVDMLQSILLFACSALLTVIAFAKAGGWNAVMAAAPPGHLHLWRPADDPSVPWPALFISLPLLGFYFWCTSQAMVQRTLSARDINHGRWGNLFAGLLNFLVFFVMVLPGIAGRKLFPDLPEANQIYPKLVFELLPKGITGLVFVGFVAALTSTLSSILNSASTLITMDFAAKLAPSMSSRQKVLIGNGSGFAVAIIAALWAPQVQKFGSVIKYFQELLGYMAPPVVAVFLFGLFWRRANGHGAFAALLSGLALSLALLFCKVQQIPTPFSGLHFLYVPPVLFAVASAVLVSVSLLTTPQDPGAIERFVWRKSFFHNESAALAALPWWQNYRVLSIALLAATLAFFLLWL